jgi:ribosomal protein S18 acetylase RimI-like enzyme
MNIRKYTSKDTKDMISVARNLPAWFTKEALKNMEIDFPLQYGYVAIANNKLVGFISGSSQDGITKISWLGINKKDRNKGIGKKLVLRLEKYFKKLGAKKMQVETVGWTDPEEKDYAQTRKFYKTVGFDKIVKKSSIKTEGKWKSKMYTYEKNI